MLDIKMKDEKTSWQEWYEDNPRLRKKLLSKLTHGIGVNDLPYAVKTRADKLRYDAKFGLETTRLP